MDVKGFQVWLSAARGLTRVPAARGARGTFGPERRRGIEGSNRAWCGRGPALSALRERRGGCARYGAGSAGATSARAAAGPSTRLSGTPLSGLHHKERWLSFGASLAKGETVKASAARCDVAVSTAFRWRHRFLAAARTIRRYSRGSWKRTRPTSWRAGRVRAGWDARHGGGAARRRSAACRASRCRFSWRRTGAGRRSCAVAAQGRCGGAHGCPRPGGREGRPAGLRRWRELPTLRRRARGEPRSTQPLDGGTGSGRSACADGEQPPVAG